MEVDIRHAVEADADAIAAIWNQVIQAGPYSALDTPVTSEAQGQFLADLSERGIFIVAEKREDQRLVGFQTLEPFATYTHAFDHVAVIGTCVHLSLRRRGVGMQLSQVGFAKAREIGIRQGIHLCSSGQPWRAELLSWSRIPRGGHGETTRQVQWQIRGLRIPGRIVVRQR